jgi:hypothetical protein
VVHVQHVDSACLQLIQDHRQHACHVPQACYMK